MPVPTTSSPGFATVVVATMMGALPVPEVLTLKTTVRNNPKRRTRRRRRLSEDSRFIVSLDIALADTSSVPATDQNSVVERLRRMPEQITGETQKLAAATARTVS